MWDAWWRLGTPEELAAILGHRPTPGNKSKAWEQGRLYARYSCHFGLQSGFLFLLLVSPPRYLVISSLFPLVGRFMKELVLEQGSNEHRRIWRTHSMKQTTSCRLCGLGNLIVAESTLCTCRVVEAELRILIRTSFPASSV